MIYKKIGKFIITEIYKFKFRKKIKIGDGCIIHTKCKFEGENRVGDRTYFANSEIGKYSYIGRNCKFYNTIIGRFCSISSEVQTISTTHPTSEFISTHPIFYSINHNWKPIIKKQKFQEDIYCKNGRSVIIENDVWIGAYVKILSGCIIHNGAIVAAGALVTKDVPEYAIVGGIPAKIIRYRFTEEEIKKLKNIKWWEWDDSLISQRAECFSNVSRFINENNTHTNSV